MAATQTKCVRHPAPATPSDIQTHKSGQHFAFVEMNTALHDMKLQTTLALNAFCILFGKYGWNLVILVFVCFPEVRVRLDFNIF